MGLKGKLGRTKPATDTTDTTGPADSGLDIPKAVPAKAGKKAKAGGKADRLSAAVVPAPPQTSFDFLDGEYAAKRRARGFTIAMNVLVAVGVVAVTAMGAPPVYSTYQDAQSVTNLQSTLSLTNRAIEEHYGIQYSEADVAAHLTARRGEMQTALGTEPNTAAVASAVYNATPAGVRIKSFSITGDTAASGGGSAAGGSGSAAGGAAAKTGPTVTIDAEAGNWDQMGAWINALSGVSMLVDVQGGTQFTSAAESITSHTVVTLDKSAIGIRYTAFSGATSTGGN
jgi:Tfp pilus assembly protein PilE